MFIDDLEKAFRKEKQAEITSDLPDSEEELTQRRPKRKPLKIIDTDDDSEIETSYVRPPPVKINRLGNNNEWY